MIPIWYPRAVGDHTPEGVRSQAADIYGKIGSGGGICGCKSYMLMFSKSYVSGALCKSSSCVPHLSALINPVYLKFYDLFSLVSQERAVADG